MENSELLNAIHKVKNFASYIKLTLSTFNQGISQQTIEEIHNSILDDCAIIITNIDLIYNHVTKQGKD